MEHKLEGQNLFEVLLQTSPVQDKEQANKLLDPSLITAADTGAALKVQRQSKSGSRSGSGWGCSSPVLCCHHGRKLPVGAPLLWHGDSTAALQEATATGALPSCFLPDGLLSCGDVLGDSLNVPCARATPLQAVGQKVTFDSPKALHRVGRSSRSISPHLPVCSCPKE